MTPKDNDKFLLKLKSISKLVLRNILKRPNMHISDVLYSPVINFDPDDTFVYSWLKSINKLWHRPLGVYIDIISPFDFIDFEVNLWYDNSLSH